MDIERVREFFKDDKFATGVGIEIEWAEEGKACCSMQIQEKHYNAGGSVQGGAIFTLGDFAFAVAANIGGQLTVSLNNSISFISVAKGKKLIAEATRLSESKRIGVYEVIITDELGTNVAHMVVNGYKKDVTIRL
ncbi:phenylacetic acid degradation protein [Sporanaerobium hydrogeniformans]|uniref:Phenylacetic acid degradation protein n=1 Tax=Sporanaerobium hydrogeniformans TaxID=3072179 RepID=A0AC61DDH8_9FIRM|nr:PaaI family thioesterase [Sporanaerobium hydrogeniformans]PHV71251.1 phenylacetic acid degradation protein [Sporanaerobium hydrogeniformans]